MLQGSTFLAALDPKVKGAVLRGGLALPERVQQVLAARLGTALGGQ